MMNDSCVCLIARERRATVVFLEMPFQRELQLLTIELCTTSPNTCGISSAQGCT